MSGIIKTIKLHELAGWQDNKDMDVYPVTSTKAIYDEDNHSLDEILESLKNIQSSSTITQENIQTKLLSIYKTSQYRPSSPVGGSYDFNADVFVAPEGWQTSSIDMEDPIWLSYGSAISSSQGIIWSIPICISGNFGTAALRRTYVATVYKNAEMKPETPVGGSYDFDTQQLTPPQGWRVDSDVSVTSSTWCSIKAFYSDDEGDGSAWSTPVRTSQSVINLTATDLNQIADRITLTTNDLQGIARNVTLNAEDLNIISKNVTLTQDQLSFIANQIDVSGSVDIAGSLNATDLIINNGYSRFNKDGSGYVANRNISWDTDGSTTVKGNIQAEGEFEGTVKAGLVYGKTKVFTEAGGTYTINPAKEPYTCYFYDLTLTLVSTGNLTEFTGTLADTYLILPNASLYDGLELEVFLLVRDESGTYTFNNVTSLYVQCAQEDKLYIRKSAKHEQITVEGITKDLYYEDTLTPFFQASSAHILCGKLAKFKAIGGAWYAIEGAFV